jgi:hypothetical protein
LQALCEQALHDLVIGVAIGIGIGIGIETVLFVLA